jgi:hypothetical protein
MAGVVSSPGLTPPSSPETPIAHDGFFPGVTLSAVRDGQRIPSQVTDKRLADAIVSAMLTVSAELETWSAAQIAAGKAKLEDVSARQLAGEALLVRLYQRAIGSFTAAELAETHGDISATNDGKLREEDRALSADEHRRNGTHAIRDMIGATRTAVELI